MIEVVSYALLDALGLIRISPLDGAIQLARIRAGTVVPKGGKVTVETTPPRITPSA